MTALQDWTAWVEELRGWAMKRINMAAKGNADYDLGLCRRLLTLNLTSNFLTTWEVKFERKDNRC
ncbi:unnamed protein product [Candida parapsilosis]